MAGTPAASCADRPRLLLDISRLLSRAAAPVPTGIDRVEMAYARHLLEHEADRLQFGALHPLGRFATLPFASVKRFIMLTEARWRDPAGDGEAVRRLGRWLLHALLLRSGDRSYRRGEAPEIYLLLSHHHLIRADVVADILRRRRARLAVMVHDLIPTDFPEYGRPREEARHRSRMQTVARHADAVLTPSDYTRRALLPWLRAAGRAHVPVHVAPLGVHLHADEMVARATTPRRADRPYFMCIGTIEPRKNHLLLLQLWRSLAERLGQDTPKLVLVGKRGWENENVLDLIERCPGLRDHVEEHNALSDEEVTALLLGCRALLFPSFAEGFGLPLAEALEIGTPAICSDIDAFREIGGGVPDYLDPLDGLGWRQAVLDYTDEGSPRRAAQTARLRDWHHPGWGETLPAALAAVEAAAGHPLPARRQTVPLSPSLPLRV